MLRLLCIIVIERKREGKKEREREREKRGCEKRSTFERKWDQITSPFSIDVFHSRRRDNRDKETNESERQSKRRDRIISGVK